MDKLDKIMQEKLQSFKPPFEQQDWLAMEKLLDNQPRKIVLFPWWKYGLAAAAFIGIISASLLSYTYQNRHEVSKEFATSNANQKSLANFSGLPIYLSNVGTLLSNQLPTAPSNFSSKKQNHSNLLNNVSTTNQFKANQMANVSTSNSIATNVEWNDNHMKQNVESISLPTLSSILLTELQENHTFNHDKMEEVILQKRSVRLFQFSMSADAGALAQISIETKTNAKELNVYSDIFSDAGINFFVTLMNRVGLYTGIKYADRKSFSRPDSLELGNNNRLLNAKSKIVGINIPIGIHFNIYDQKYCSVYSKVGINNIIPLQETIRYETIDNTNSNAPLIETTTNIGNTKFSASADNSVSFDTKSVSYSTNANNSNPLPVKHTLHQKPNEKYLAELQIAFGLKVKATRNLAFNIEPAYLLDFKNRHRAENSSNFAFNTGISYSF